MSDIQRLATSAQGALNGGKLLLIFLLDGSASNKGFNEMKSTVETCIEMLSDGSQIAILQFSTTTSVIISPTEDKAAAKKALQGATQMNGTTNTGEGLKQAKIMVLKQEYKTLNKVIFVFTDGRPNDLEQVVVESSQLQSQGKIFAIGCGSGISFDHLTQISGHGQTAFKITNGVILGNLFKLIQSSPEPPCVINFTPKSCNMNSGKPMELVGTLVNNRKDTILAGALVEFPESDYFDYTYSSIVTEIVPQSSASFQVKLAPKASAMRHDVPTEINWTAKISTSDNAVTIQGIADIPTGLFRGDFYHEHPINLLFIGSMGAGKSSLINSIIQSLSLTADVHQVANVGKLQDHITREYTPYPLSNFIHGPGANYIPFVLWDSWGTTATDYQNLRISSFVQGAVKIGQSRNEVRQNIHSEDRSPARCSTRAIHVVVIVVPITAYLEVGSMERVGAICEELRDLDMSPIVVVTRIDEISKDDLEEEKKMLLAKLQTTEANVFFHSNYTAELGSDKTIDKSSRKILLAIMTRAMTRLKKMPVTGNPDWSAVHPNFAIPEIVCSKGHLRPHNWKKADGTMKTFCKVCASPYLLYECLEGHVQPKVWYQPFCATCGKVLSLPANDALACGLPKIPNAPLHHVPKDGKEGGKCTICGGTYVQKKLFCVNSDPTCDEHEPDVDPEEPDFCGDCGGDVFPSTLLQCNDPQRDVPPHLPSNFNFGKFCRICGGEVSLEDRSIQKYAE